MFGSFPPSPLVGLRLLEAEYQALNIEQIREELKGGQSDP
jgi:hypothetical protein